MAALRVEVLAWSEKQVSGDDLRILNSTIDKMVADVAKCATDEMGAEFRVIARLQTTADDACGAAAGTDAADSIASAIDAIIAGIVIIEGVDTAEADADDVEAELDDEKKQE